MIVLERQGNIVERWANDGSLLHWFVCLYIIDETSILCADWSWFAPSAKAPLCLNPFANKPWFSHVCYTSLLKTLQEKEKLLITSNFSFSQCFVPFWEISCHFHQVQNCLLQTLSVWKSQKFIVWERVNSLSHNPDFWMNLGVQNGSVVKHSTRNPGVLGLNHIGSSGFFLGIVLWQDASES